MSYEAISDEGKSASFIVDSTAFMGLFAPATMLLLYAVAIFWGASLGVDEAGVLNFAIGGALGFVGVSLIALVMVGVCWGMYKKNRAAAALGGVLYPVIIGSFSVLFPSYASCMALGFLVFWLRGVYYVFKYHQIVAEEQRLLAED